MGANYVYDIRSVKEEELQGLFEEMVNTAITEHGTAPYSGSWSEKEGEGIEIIPGAWREEEAREHCQDNNDKWGPAFAYCLIDGRWYIGGWCSM